MDALKFVRERNRMCKSFGEGEGCMSCPVYKKGNHCMAILWKEEIVPIVEKWSKEHPYKTRQSEYLKQWPKTRVEDNGWFSDNKKDWPEDILLKKGFICIRSGDMYKRARNDQGTILDITTIQQNWLQDRWAELNTDQRKDCKDMIETFGDPSRFAREVLQIT